MNCPYCGAPMSETDTYCSQCDRAVDFSVPKNNKIPINFRHLIVVTLLYGVALISIFYGMNTRTRLTGTWAGDVAIPNTNTMIHRQYEFSPFGIMSETSGATTVKGAYHLQGNKIVFTPDRDESATEEIDFRLTLGGKLYLHGDAAHPFTIQGIPYAAIFILIGVVAVFVASYLLHKKILRPRKEETMVLDDESVVREEHSAFGYMLPPESPPYDGEWFETVDPPVSETAYHTTVETTSSALDFFHSGGDL